eukprot:gene5044-135_t
MKNTRLVNNKYIHQRFKDASGKAKAGQTRADQVQSHYLPRLLHLPLIRSQSCACACVDYLPAASPICVTRWNRPLLLETHIDTTLRCGVTVGFGWAPDSRVPPPSILPFSECQPGSEGYMYM